MNENFNLDIRYVSNTSMRSNNKKVHNRGTHRHDTGCTY